MCKTLLKTLLFIVILVIGSFYFFSQPLLSAYANFFTVHTATKKADMILILSGGVQTRPAKAIELYKQDYASHVYVTQVASHAKKYKNFFKTSYGTTQEIFAHENIPLQLLKSQKGGATSTFDEAYDAAFFIKKNPHIKKIILVTDDFHTRRALFAFKKVFSLQELTTTIEIEGAQNNIFSEKNWWKTEAGIISYFLEPLKLLVYYFNSKNLSFIKEH